VSLRISSSLTSLIILVGIANVASADNSIFKYDPDKIETGVVYQYVKSNIDGSRHGNVSLFIASKDQLESLKWHQGESEATLAIATMDWDSFSVRRFETWRLRVGQENQLRVVADYDKDKLALIASAGDRRLQTRIDNWPWHSYDFDFSSLNFSFRHLVDPKKPFNVGITDIVRTDDGPKLADKGTVKIVYKRDIHRHGHICREYSIDGPGLENKGGTLWIHKADGVLVDFEIALADEPGFDSGKLRLTGIERMTAKEWDAYKSSRFSTE
jgi:hypothetical protein